MIIELLLLIGGLVAILLGANWLVDGSSSIARKAGVSEFIIGLTIVGIGTSMPEFVVSCTGAFKGNADIAIGNVIGSNIFNTLIILGITALLCPITITRSNKMRDIPLNFIVALLLVLLGMKNTIFGLGSNTISRIEGIIMLVLFAAYLYISFKNDKAEDTQENKGKEYKTPIAIVMILFGLLALIFGGQLFVDSATSLAKSWGISDKFIAITILAGGTSLPELATCIVAARKSRAQLALGNVLGSNISNILMILGASSVIHPLSFGNINIVDVCALLVSGLFLILCGFVFKKRNRLHWQEGVILLLIEAVYMFFLVKSIL